MSADVLCRVATNNHIGTVIDIVWTNCFLIFRFQSPSISEPMSFTFSYRIQLSNLSLAHIGADLVVAPSSSCTLLLLSEVARVSCV